MLVFHTEYMWTHISFTQSMDEAGAADARPRRGVSRTTRSTVKPIRRSISNVLHEGGSSADEEEEEEDEEMEEGEEEPGNEADEGELDAVDAAYRASPTAKELHTLEKGTLVRISKTPDVEQRVPHTVYKVGVVEEVPQHPNTWFKVRIRDGDVVYKYRPSALEVIEDEDDASSTGGSPLRSPVVHHDETNFYDNAEAEDEDESERKEENEGGYMKPGVRVKLKLGALNAAEKRYLKNYDGREGVVTGRGKASIKVLIDGDEDITLKVRQNHLVVMSDEQVEEDEEEREGDKEAEEEKKPSMVSKKRRGKGKLLSTLDPDMWIDRKCRINVGKFKGQHGRVLRSGNGWVQLRLENSSENTAKRAYELTLLEDMHTIKMLHAKTLEKEQKHRPDSRANKANLEMDDGEDEEEDDEASQSGMDDLVAAEMSDESQGEDSGKRSRRVSTRGNYGISWIKKKVNLPNRKGFGIVKKADRDTCTVEIQTTKVLQVFKKKDLQLAGDSHAKTARQNSRNRNNAKAREKLGLGDDVVLMGTTPSRYVAFQDLVKRFAMRRREKFKKRPNLIEWEARLNLNYLENGFWDRNNPSVIDLVVVPQCDICGMEKEKNDNHCWNNECPRCPAFDVDSFDPKSENAFMRLPIVPFPNDNMTISLCQQKVSSTQKRKRRSLDDTPIETSQVHMEQSASPTYNALKAEREVAKSKKFCTASNDTETEKIVGAGFASQNDLNKTKVVDAKTVEPEEIPKMEVAGVLSEAIESESSPVNAYRPRYDSIFLR